MSSEENVAPTSTPGDIAIRVSSLSKCYQIYDRPADRLKQSLFPRVQKFVGKQAREYYREFWALQNVSFEVHVGETVGIVGRNGSGKSTLLQLICGTLYPTSGTVQTHGRIAALLELGSGFNPDFTGRENIYMNGAVLGLSQETIDTRYDDIVAYADIGPFIDQSIKMYSSGMVVRLAFSVAINVAPQILIVDEALSVGDESFQRKCFASIEQLKKTGTTILFVSHSSRDVAALCDRAVLLEAGEMVCCSTPKRVISMYHSKLYSSEFSGTSAHSMELQHEPFSEAKDQSCESDHTGFFNPSLQPDSTINYPAMDVSISDIVLVDDFGRKRNVLLHGKSYVLSYRIMVETDLHNAVLGFHFKNVTGLEVGGIFYPSDQDGISLLATKASYVISFPFVVRMCQGDYFITVGVRSYLESTFRHRIVDALRIVVPPEDGLSYFGMCNLRSSDHPPKLIGSESGLHDHERRT